jgi:cytochrome b pre-mRNA-processing protein 3
MSLISRLLGKPDDSREALRPLWNRVIELAREPDWYARLGVADTTPGRFDMLTLVLAVVLLRMEREEALIGPSALLSELFVEDMDGQLRQSGVGDLVVGKRIGKLMGALGGRLGALREASADGMASDAALTEVVRRNVTLRDGADPAAIAARLRAIAEAVNKAGATDLLAGRIAP